MLQTFDTLYIGIIMIMNMVHVLKMTYKTPGTCIIGTCTCMFTGFHIFMCLGNKYNLSENHSCIIQIISKVFNIRECEKTKN